MSSTLVTGGSGLVGFNIGAALRRRGRSVRYLARSPERSKQAADRVVAEAAVFLHPSGTAAANTSGRPPRAASAATSARDK